VISRRITPERRGRRFITAIAALGLIAGSMLATGTALAVHDADFQLDGDTTEVDRTPSEPGNPTLDWDSLFTATGGNTSAIDPTNDPGFTHGDFVRDFRLKLSRTDCSLTSTDATKPFCTADTTTYATGSKDTLAVSGWQCNKDNNVNSKIDIMNAYAASYTAADGDKLIYFGLDKNKDNGDNNVGFWFLQGNADCDASNGTATWSGAHTNGDVLVVSEFTNGGGVSGITAYQWSGGANGCIDRPGNATACDGLSFGQGTDCKTSSAPDNICATTNSGTTAWNTNVNTQWLTADATIGVGHTVVPPDFFEGGINLTQIFQAAGGTAPQCFNTFIADTRSSQQTTATLFDYARGQLGECSASVQTTPSLTSTTLTSSDPITDLANVSGTNSSGAAGPKPTGTISFSLCGPGVTSCTSGGQAVGSAVTLGDCDPDAAGHSCATSDNVRSLVTAGGVGTYCFRAVYNAGTDPNYQASNGALDGSAGECFTVGDSSGITTDQDWLPNDSATVTTGGSPVSGTVTFTLYEDADCGTTAPTAVKATFTDSTPADGFTTDNSTVYTSSQTISWKATFVSDNGVTGSTSNCETSSVTINNNH